MATRRGRGEGGIRQRADGRWEGSIDLGWTGGKRVRKFVYGRTRADAAAKLRELRGRLDAGLPDIDARLTVGAYLEGWLRDSLPASVKPTTAENYGWVVRTYIVPSLGKVRLAKLSPADVDLMLRDLEDRGLSENTRRLARSVLRRALVFAERRGQVARNAAGIAEPVHVERRPHRVLSVAEARRLLAVVRGDRLEALWTLALVTGLREGELLGLRWDDIDLQRGELQVRGTLKRLSGQGLVRTSAKNRASAAGVPLIGLAVDSLGHHGARQIEERLAAAEWTDEGYVFTTPLGGPIDPRNLLRSWYALRERADLPAMTVHDLRHTTATLLRNLGVPMDVVSRILRHSGIAVTADVYAEVGHDLARGAVDVLGRALGDPRSSVPVGGGRSAQRRRRRTERASPPAREPGPAIPADG